VKIFISNSAFYDLESIKKYYTEEDVPHIGEQFVVSIINHMQTLNDNPDIGRVVPEFDDKKIGELIHPPFRIVYLREKNSVQVVRIWRSERVLRLAESNEADSS
jgi:plasmid stabilization system protein ParE